MFKYVAPYMIYNKSHRIYYESTLYNFNSNLLLFLFKQE
jgi:hypothetical protein